MTPVAFLCLLILIKSIFCDISSATYQSVLYKTAAKVKSKGNGCIIAIDLNDAIPELPGNIKDKYITIIERARAFDHVTMMNLSDIEKKVNRFHDWSGEISFTLTDKTCIDYSNGFTLCRQIDGDLKKLIQNLRETYCKFDDYKQRKDASVYFDEQRLFSKALNCDGERPTKERILGNIAAKSLFPQPDNSWIYM